MADENPDPKNPSGPEPESEPLRLKVLAEQKYVAGNLKSALKYAKRAHRLQPTLEALPEMITAFKILRTATKPITSTPPHDDDDANDAVSTAPAPPDYYKILQIERFAHINAIKKQYKKLALTLHPDKNPFIACEEAFKHVGEAFRVLSDRIRRKEYDMRLRIAMQIEAEAAAGVAGGGVEEVETFWTACSTCRLLHKFERKYFGHNLVCPSCKKTFKAVEVVVGEEKKGKNAGTAERVEEGDAGANVGVRTSERIKARKLGKMSSVGEVLETSRGKRVVANVGKKKGLEDSDGVIGGLRSRNRRKEESGGGVEGTRTTKARTKRVKIDDEEVMMTLAEMQMLAKKKVSEERMKLKGKEKAAEKEREKEKEMDKEKEIEKEKEKETDKVMGNKEANEKEDEEVAENDKQMEDEIELENENEEEEMEKDREKKKQKIDEKKRKMGTRKVKEKEEREKDGEKKQQKINEKKRKMGTGKVNEREKTGRKGVSSNERSMAVVGRRASKSSRDLVIEKRKRSRNNREIVAVEASDFFDFDKDREDRSFKKGQVWAIYDSEDGMPRHYALIDEVVSLNPFQVKLSWLEFQSNGDEQLISWEKLGFHISCGRFKVSEKASVKSLKMFSHLPFCERAAREVYGIYPKKGSIWALYNEKALDSDKNQIMKDKTCYDIVVFLTSYNEIHGLSMAYLEKVDGFRSIFKRKDIGAHAIKWLEKDDFRLFSHQIPGRKLSGEEAPGLPKDCWELDPAALPPDSLTIGWVDETVE